ncbi:MAG: glutamate formimidoyltransferase [Acidobacteriota bacterium]
MFFECVPNVSEGRRPEIVAALAAACKIRGARVLDVHSDADHNRSVLTLAGTAHELHGGVLALFDAAIEAIDLRAHQGVHPRVGAVDVVPFVPLHGASMKDASAVAEHLAEAVASDFALPVYLYEYAARRSERRALPLIRRGGFEGFGEKIRRPGWAPDLGPATVHPSAGVTVVGSRFFLVALNVVLESANLELARSIARQVRESSGGLAALRAIGVELSSRGVVQVSLNLLDYRVTSMTTAFAAVEAAAARAGVAVRASELVGLVPAAALPMDPERELALRVAPEKVLENALRAHGLDGAVSPG